MEFSQGLDNSLVPIYSQVLDEIEQGVVEDEDPGAVGKPGTRLLQSQAARRRCGRCRRRSVRRHLGRATLPSPVLRRQPDQHVDTMFGGDAMTDEVFRYPLATLLARTESLLTAEFDQRLAAAGFPDLSFALGTNILRHLDADAGLRVGALAEMSVVTKQAISQQLAHVQAHGYVIVERDPADSRAKTVRLTKRGAESQRVARRLFAELERDWRDRYGHERLRQLRDHLEVILFSGHPDGAVPATENRGGRKE